MCVGVAHSMVDVGHRGTCRPRRCRPTLDALCCSMGQAVPFGWRADPWDMGVGLQEGRGCCRCPGGAKHEWADANGSSSRNDSVDV